MFRDSVSGLRKPGPRKCWHAPGHRGDQNPVRREPSCGWSPSAGPRKLRIRGRRSGGLGLRRAAPEAGGSGLGAGTGHACVLHQSHQKQPPSLGRLCQRALCSAKLASKSLLSILPPSCEVGTLTFLQREQGEAPEFGNSTKMPRCHGHRGDSSPGLWPQDGAPNLCECSLPLQVRGDWCECHFLRVLDPQHTRGEGVLPPFY